MPPWQSRRGGLMSIDAQASCYSLWVSRSLLSAVWNLLYMMIKCQQFHLWVFDYDKTHILLIPASSSPFSSLYILVLFQQLLQVGWQFQPLPGLFQRRSRSKSPCCLHSSMEGNLLSHPSSWVTSTKYSTGMLALSECCQSRGQKGWTGIDAEALFCWLWVSRGLLSAVCNLLYMMIEPNPFPYESLTMMKYTYYWLPPQAPNLALCIVLSSLHG